MEDQEFDVMIFGGCYLGKHLKVVEDMQRKAVEQEVALRGNRAYA